MVLSGLTVALRFPSLPNPMDTGTGSIPSQYIALYAAVCSCGPGDCHFAIARMTKSSTAHSYEDKNSFQELLFIYGQNKVYD